jgi:rSAM/selenodomain-associated transferase 2
MPLVSIIIPTINEAQNVVRILDALCAFPDCEVIVADGGSTDGTQTLLQHSTLRLPNLQWIQSPKGRARQMNAGARSASGTWLIFLHADTHLPTQSFLHFSEIVQSASYNQLEAGAFTFRVEHNRRVYRYLEWYVRQRCRFLKMPFGDQAIFARRDLFERIGGYRSDYPLMEDMEFVQRVKNHHSNFRVLDAPVFTSARRFEQDGYMRRTLGNVYLQLLYAAGVHPERLAERYYKPS